jgi:hypothetical protein
MGYTFCEYIRNNNYNQFLVENIKEIYGLNYLRVYLKTRFIKK